MGSDIRAVVFDIGNVLIGWQPEDYYDRVIGEDRRRALFSSVDLHAMNLAVDAGGDFRGTIYGTAEKHPDWGDEIRRWHDDWLELAGPVIDRSVRLMRALRAKGVPVHALTNFGVGSFDLAAGHFDFLNEFDIAFVSGRMQMVKPDPAIYAAVEDETGLLPDTILFADDRPDNIKAATARGWHAHLFETPEGWADRLVAEGLLTEAEAA
ncbi:HAD-IA family hydrolase [Rhodobacterales bacterium HKCCE2091]|nr:HAD-IA family hydrolase [Rhodobacterales bacterium HKCCE2091]